jgi:hypothetical protein
MGNCIKKSNKSEYNDNIKPKRFPGSNKIDSDFLSKWEPIIKIVLKKHKLELSKIIKKIPSTDAESIKKQMELLNYLEKCEDDLLLAIFSHFTFSPKVKYRSLFSDDYTIFLLGIQKLEQVNEIRFKIYDNSINVQIISLLEKDF